jgi:fructose-bisphosphate aldolase class II
VERTHCDSLAVAIGTSHGAYKFKGEPKLDFERLKAIQAKLPQGYPLVLHGASSAGSVTEVQAYIDLCNQYGGEIKGSKGTPEELFAEAIKHGVCKINIDTDLRLVMTGALRRELSKNPSNFDPRKYMGPMREELQTQIQRKMRVLGCSGKA